MSTVNNGPQIIRNGFVLDLDAGYMRSYSPNVFPNPTDLLGWSQMTGVIQSCTITRDTSQTRQYGSIPIRMAITGNDPFTGGYGYLAANLASALSGQTWTISVWAKASVATDGQLFIFGADTNGAWSVTPDYSAGTIAITTSWQRFSFSYTFTNANTRYIQFRLDGTNVGGSGITIWWDGLQVERASSVTPFNPYYFGNTVWKDVSGNNRTATLTNGPLFNSSNGGNIIFDGVDDYVITPSGGSYSEYTFMFFCKWITDTANGSRIFGCDGFGTYTIFTPSNVAFHYNQAAGSSTVLSSGVNVGLGTWCHVAVTVSTLSSSARIYINGSLTNATSTIPYVNLSGNLFIGAQYTNLLANCNIALFQLYNRVLSATEISQNFQTDKTRFGL